MKKLFTYHLLLFSIVVITDTMSAKNVNGPTQYFTAPRPAAGGVLFSDQKTNGLFFFTGSGVETISRMPGSGMYYTVSPDGRYAGYKEVLSDGMQMAVVYDLERKSAAIVQTAASRVGQISFAGDGTMAFTEGEQLIVLSNESKKRYALGTYANIAPISPDGKYSVYNDQEDQLWLLDLATSSALKITNNNGSYALPQWSPDGSQILFSRLSGAMFIYSLVSQNIVNIGDGESPSWIDNSTVAYVRKQIDQGEVTSTEICCVNSNGTNRRQLTSTTDTFETDPVFDQRTGTIIYSDLKRGGLYSRILTVGTMAEAEHQLLPADRSFLSQPMINRSIASSAPSTAAAVYFEMPYVHQVWDTPDWYNGHSACGATSSIMVIAYYNIVPKWNVWCSPSGSSPGHYSPYGNYVCENYSYREIAYSLSASDPNGKPSYGGYGFMWTGSYSPYSRTVAYYTNHGMSATRYDSSASFFTTVIANADSGYPFTLCNGLTTAGHIIVVNGYDVNNRTLIVNDPYGNKNTNVYPSLNGKGVKYDWVGYNNGYKNLNRIYWGVSVRYRMEAQADSLVDDAQLNKGFYLHTAAPSSLTRWSDRKSGGYMNGHFWWTRTKTGDTCYAVWNPTLAKAGKYEVEAYIPLTMGDAVVARYKVIARDSMYTVIVNQQANKGTWVTLGTYPFAQGTAGYVRLGDASDTTTQAMAFDAVRWTYTGEAPLSVASSAHHPETFSLEQNYPNPFNPSTIIEFTLPYRSNAVLAVSDLLGKEVVRVVDGTLDAGTHRYRLTAATYRLSSGMYFYTLRTGTAVQSKRMIILK